MKTTKCDRCEDKEAVVRVTVTTLDGTILDHAKYCKPCVKRALLELDMSIGNHGEEPE